MALPVKVDLPRSPINYSDEYKKFHELRLLDPNLTPSGTVTFPSNSSGTVYTSTSGEAGLLTILQNALGSYLFTAADYNLIQTEINNSVALANLLAILGESYFKASNYGVVITKSASYTLALTDANSVTNMTGASSQTITIPPNSSVAFPIGTQITVLMNGAGAVVFAPGSGVTLTSKDTKRTIDGQYASATLIKTATDSWTLIGALKA